MSSRLSRCLKSLEGVGFLHSSHIANTPNIELANHGHLYAKQLQQQWLNMRQLAIYFNISETEPCSHERFSFVHSKQFQSHLEQLRQTYPAKIKCPSVVKHERCLGNVSKPNSIFMYAKPVNQMITDFYVEAHRGLELFYNVQRESKIWWMRFSSNPSRYDIVPAYSQSELDQNKGCQAVDIRASFGDAGQITVEELSLVPLPNDEAFLFPNTSNKNMQPPAIIRSVIQLEPATCALLLEGCDHGREARSLLLNRVMAPYQCGIAAIQLTDNADTHDIRDLCKHMVSVLQHAQLRLQNFENDHFVLAKNFEQLTQHLKISDCLGVPYTLILDEKQTLTTGLIQLRNRDTQLSESIHISDLPEYLLNIFRNY